MNEIYAVGIDRRRESPRLLAGVYSPHFGPSDAYPAGIYFGTRDGDVYGSADEGDTWQPIAAHLPGMLCVRAVVL